MSRPYPVTDPHCPECGVKATCFTHNMCEMLVWVCDECGEEWLYYEYPEQKYKLS